MPLFKGDYLDTSTIRFNDKFRGELVRRIVTSLDVEIRLKQLNVHIVVQFRKDEDVRNRAETYDNLGSLRLWIDGAKVAFVRFHRRVCIDSNDQDVDELSSSL